MKTILSRTLVMLGFVIGVFGFFACSLAGGGVHALKHWSFIGWLGLGLPVLVPYSFSLVMTYKNVSLAYIKHMIILSVSLDILLLVSVKIEHEHMVGFLDAIWGISFWGTWQVAILLAYFLKLISSKSLIAAS